MLVSGPEDWSSVIAHNEKVHEDDTQGWALVRTILFRKNRVGYVNHFLTLRVQEHIADKTA